MASSDGPSQAPEPVHLLLLVHGLADTHAAWDNLCSELGKTPNPTLLVHSSRVNGRWKTHHGLDVCGQRLADELKELVAKHSTLRELSVIGHSMGGLIGRYACGVLFRPEDGTVAGLRPRHYVSLASPHLGLTVDDGPAQVPFVAWAGHIPLMGKAVKRGLQSAGHAVARTFFRGTGAHFLALDGAPGLLPLLVRLAMDCPDRGEYFFSALRAFATRACYGNVKGDHWVSWENATVRPTSELPAIDPHAVRHGRGVVHEDPVEAGAVRPGHSPKAGPEASGKAKEQEQGQGQEQPRSQEALLEAASHTPPPPERTGSSVPVTGASGREGGKGQGPTEGAAADGAADGLSEAALAEEVEREDESPEQVSALALARLQQLPWRRVDCSFGGAWMGTSHNNIQATRWTNLVGRSVLAHLHAHLQASEALLARMEAGAAAQGVAAVPDSAGEAAAPAGAGQGSG